MKYQTNRPEPLPPHRLIEFGLELQVEKRVNYVLENAETTSIPDSKDSSEDEVAEDE